jgi:hypothetical protein
MSDALTVSACIACGDALRIAPCGGQWDERLAEFAAADDVGALRALAAVWATWNAFRALAVACAA